jgi:hypothetical protein
MYIWNFSTPVTLLACLLWNAAEFTKIGLGRFAPSVFGCAIGCKKKRLQD